MSWLEVWGYNPTWWGSMDHGWGQKCASETPPHVSTSEEAESRECWHVCAWLSPPPPPFIQCELLVRRLVLSRYCLHSGKVWPAQPIVSANSLVAMPRSWVDNENWPSRHKWTQGWVVLKHYGDCVQLLENTSALLLQGLGYSEALSGMHWPAVTFLITHGLWGFVAGEGGHKMSYPQVILDLLAPR